MNIFFDWVTDDCNANKKYICDLREFEPVSPPEPMSESEPTEVSESEEEPVLTPLTYTPGEFEYLIGDQPVSQEVAEQACIEWNGSLASINSPQEAAEIYGMLEIDGFYFIGLNEQRQEGTWVNPDGSPFSYVQWEQGQPGNDSTDEDCVAVSHEGSRTEENNWHDLSCNYPSFYICKRPYQEPESESEPE